MQTTEEMQSLFDNLRPARYRQTQELVGYERGTGGGEIQPMGWVINKDATVIIDESGIIIEDGALTFRDEFGETVLSGAGFGGTWLRFIASGVYNNNFAASVLTTDLVANPVSLPFWLAETANAAVKVIVQTDAAAPSGKSVKFEGTAAGSILATLYQENIPVIPNQRYTISALINHTATAGFPINLNFGISWYDGSGTFLSAESSGALEFTVGSGGYITRRLGVFTAPATAAAARVSISATSNAAGWDVGDNSVTIGDVALDRLHTATYRQIINTAAVTVPDSAWTRVTGYTNVFDNLYGDISFDPNGVDELEVHTPGWYRIHGVVGWDTNTTGFRVLGLSFANNAAPGSTPLDENKRAYTPHSGSTAMEINWEGFLNLNDCVALTVFQNSGASRSLDYAKLSVTRVA